MAELLARADLWVIFGYLAAMLWIGWHVTDGARDVEGYTVGNRAMSGWVVGFSVLGTFLSSITFLGLPATVYKNGNWTAFAFGLALPVAALAAVWFFIPLYRRGIHLSAYELLERRFGYWARGYAAVSYVVLQLLRVAMVYLLVALAVEPLLGWGVIPTLIGLGLVVIVYDVMGGIKAVIWTDVLQVFVLLGGALWVLAELVLSRPGGARQLWNDLPAGSFSLGELASTDLAATTFLVVFLYGITENLRNYGTDQNYIQRFLCARSQRDAARSIWLGALSYVPISMIFCLIGTGLLAFYRVPVGATPASQAAAVQGAPDRAPLPPHAPADQVFPHFIQHELHPLARGMVIAGILAAAMSTADSCLNSMSMIVLVDLVRRFRRSPPRLPEIVTLRLFTAAAGTLATLGAISIHIGLGDQGRTLMEKWWQYAGVAGSGLFGLFLLAWLLPRVPAWGAALAVIVSLPVLVWGTACRPANGRTDWAWDNCPLHPNLVGIAGFTTLLATGSMLALLVRAGLLSANHRCLRESSGSP